MPETLLRTKLYFPPLRPNLVRRPQLIEGLNHGLQLGHKLTLVSAPAGFGKTTLISGWLGQLSSEYNVSWLSLEESDSDPSRFLLYLIASLQTVYPAIGKDLALSAPLPPLESANLILINEISAVSQPIILVLDDYHFITAPAIHQATVYLLDHMPPQMHLVIISRSDPPFSLSKWRVRHQLAEIRARDLRFTLAEATEFLNQTMALALSVEEVTLLENRTEGWVAGLQLAAHSLQSEDDNTTFLTAFAGDDRYIADYLVEEVLTHQPETIQSFLLQTSILNRLSSPLCNALLERQDSQTVLAYLEESNLFVVPLDNRRQWFRYHQLFSDMLHERLEALLEKAPYLHRRASQWYADNDFIPEAVEHALSAADYDEAIQLILICAAEMFMTNRLSTLLQWWQELPEEMATQNPKLCMMAAWAWLATGHKYESEQCLQAIEKSLSAPMSALLTDINTLKAEIRNGLIEVAAIRVSFQTVSQVDVTETLAICQRILPFLIEEDQSFLFNPPIALRPVVLLNMGLAYQILGRLDEAVIAFEESVKVGKALGNVHIVAPSFGYLAEVEIVQGRLHQAAETCHRGIDLVATLAGKITPMTGLLHIRLGQLSFEWNDLETAVRHFQEGITLAKPWRHREALLPGYLGLARAYGVLGRTEEAQVVQEAFDELLAEEPVAADSLVSANHAWLLAQQGNVEEARRWADSVTGDNEEPLIESVEIILARVHLLQGKHDESTQILDMLLPAAESGELWGRVVELLVLQAMSYDAQGYQEAALESLSRALEKAESEGYVRTFVDSGQTLARLLREGQRSGRMPSYGNKLLMAFQSEKQAERKHEKTISPRSNLVDPLSDRELEVLHYIAEGLTNKEIAARLYLSLGTVKVHTHNIYCKLGISGRTQAVKHARELGLL